jgi:hypothetical protein
MVSISRERQRQEIMQAAEAMALLATTFADVAADPNSTQKALNACSRLVLDLTELMKVHQNPFEGDES